ncbi:hypothetical protein QCA50_018538 [Cerrena zonata]|uniref:Uncharacterized protein n=1 Tax=Cerrena zonata TaxID=2478898 RepID=A0AAW0FCI7_9APHY
MGAGASWRIKDLRLHTKTIDCCDPRVPRVKVHQDVHFGLDEDQTWAHFPSLPGNMSFSNVYYSVQHGISRRKTVVHGAPCPIEIILNALALHDFKLCVSIHRCKVRPGVLRFCITRWLYGLRRKGDA